MSKNKLSEYFESLNKNEQIVTLFMLTYKRPDYVKLAIESVLNQTYSNFYLIVLDNMSKDNTKEVVESFNDERVIYIEHDGNLTGSNFAYAFRLVRTKYIIVLHDDDILNNDYLEKIIFSMLEHKELTALSPTNGIIDANGIVKDIGCSYDGVNVFKEDEYFYSTVISCSQKQSMVFPAVIYNHDLLGNIDEYLDERTGPSGDQYIWYEICRRGGKIGILGMPLIQYRRHDKQDSTVNAGILVMKLLGFLYTKGYYAEILDKNLSLLSSHIKDSLIASLSLFERGIYDEDKLKEVYSLIPQFLSKNWKCRWYMICFRMFIALPNISAIALRVFRRIRR